MSEELQGANQSAATAEPIAASAAPAAPAATEQQSALSAPITTPGATTTEPSGIKVKFNHEERMIGLDEAPTWIQKGMNYDKLQERTTQYEQQAKNLERVAKYYGFEKPEEYLQALDDAEMDQKIKAEAARMQVPEEFIRNELQPLKDKIQSFEQKEESLKLKELQLEIGTELTRLKEANPDFTTYEPKIFEMVKTKGYSLEHAYIIASHEDKIAKTAQEAEATAIRNLQQNAQSATGPLGAEGPEEKSGYMSMTPAERKAFRDRVKRDG